MLLIVIFSLCHNLANLYEYVQVGQSRHVYDDDIITVSIRAVKEISRKYSQYAGLSPPEIVSLFQIVYWEVVLILNGEGKLSLFRWQIFSIAWAVVPWEVPDAGAGPLHHAAGRGRAAGGRPAAGPQARPGRQVRGIYTYTSYNWCNVRCQHDDTTAMSGDVCYVRLERPLPRRGVRGEALGQPHASLLQLHSQQVGTYKYYKKYIIKMDQLCQTSWARASQFTGRG